MSGVLEVCLALDVYDFVLISLQNPHYNKRFGVNGQGPIVASMPAGSFFGALFVSWLADRIGRKKTVMLAGIIWVIGAILQCASAVRLP
jgi:MFS family permease